MTNADVYIDSVLDMMPRATPLRAQIAMELRAHIAERLDEGHSIDAVLEQLGDPAQLADSYLSANPLVAAPLGDRLAAKMIDALAVVAVVGPLAWMVSRLAAAVPFWIAFLVGVLLCGSFFLCLYTIIAEYNSAEPLGKRARGIHVVRESGRRISLGQAIVRQLPIVLSIFLIDAFFALFTDKKQRAFELLSKTRVVVAGPQETPEQP